MSYTVKDLRRGLGRGLGVFDAFELLQGGLTFELAARTLTPQFGERDKVIEQSVNFFFLEVRYSYRWTQ